MEKTNFSGIPVIIVGINMLVGLTIKEGNLWLHYKRSKTQIHIYKIISYPKKAEGTGKHDHKFSKSNIQWPTHFEKKSK